MLTQPYLETQSSAQVPGSDSGKQENNQQCLAAQNNQPSYANCLCSGRGTKTTKDSTKDQVWTPQDWQMLVDMGQRLTVTSEIAITNLRPDLVLWSNSQHMVYFVELTVPWEDAVQEAFERNKL
ncbi:hypothetical protein SKAU_G00398760 [Synaphobranchus kaupii]|uniref:Uncharacterized protein n=1 Tax=Synaphobranchus kaupii TaxID=118154 RepID=A0A9Q1E8Q7_SYNKA|nr:hypothetical protein SKAU_G00398760 [Synaphobranchus kaupii]